MTDHQPDIRVELAGVKLKNPLVVASGFPETRILIRFIEAGVGGVTTKTVTPKPRAGHPPPTVIDVGIGYINAVGLKNPGIDGFEEEMRDLVSIAKRHGAVVIGSAGGDNIEGYVKVASRLEEYGAHMIELNVSCPTVKEVYSTGTDLKLLEETVREVKSVLRVPLIVKLSPDIREIGKASRIALRAGGDALALVNTISPATAIDIWSGKPKLGNPEGFGGLSGRAVKPVAIAKVLEAYLETKADILGMGGVLTWEDLVEFILAGSKAVAFLTAFFRYRNFDFVNEWLSKLKGYMTRKGYTRIDEFRGYASSFISRD